MKIQIFDPPMCCSTGICGAEVDPTLVAFTADLDWLKRQGIEVERYNLSQQTQAFVSNQTVCDALKKDGNDCLPLILVDGNIASHGTYLSREKLAELTHLKYSETESKSETKAQLKFTVQQADAKNSAGPGCCSAQNEKEDSKKEDSDKKTSCC